MRYYILIKRKSSKQWLGAIPAKKNASLLQLRRIKTRTGFVKKIVSESQLKRLLSKIKPRVTRRKTTKRRITRRKTTKRRSKRKPLMRRRRTKVVRRKKRR